MSVLKVNNIRSLSGATVQFGLTGSLGDATAETTNVKILGNLEVVGTANIETSDFVVNATTMTLGDASTDTITFSGSNIACPNGLKFDTSTLVLDASNNRVGVGTTSP